MYYSQASAFTWANENVMSILLFPWELYQSHEFLPSGVWILIWPVNDKLTEFFVIKIMYDLTTPATCRLYSSNSKQKCRKYRKMQAKLMNHQQLLITEIDYKTKCRPGIFCSEQYCSWRFGAITWKVALNNVITSHLNVPLCSRHARGVNSEEFFFWTCEDTNWQPCNTLGENSHPQRCSLYGNKRGTVIFSEYNFWTWPLLSKMCRSGNPLF